MKTGLFNMIIFTFVPVETKVQITMPIVIITTERYFDNLYLKNINS